MPRSSGDTAKALGLTGEGASSTLALVKPLTGILLAIGALGAIAGAAWYENKKASQVAAPVTAGATSPLSLTGGHLYLATVTLASAVSGSSTQASVQAALPNTLTVTSVTATPTTIAVGIDCQQDTSLPIPTLLQAVAAPSGSLVNLQDQGLNNASGAGANT